MIETTLKIRLYGDPCLRKKSSPVKEIGPTERFLISQMIKTMHEHKGIGLAAPQVGINQQILVADIGEGPIAILNPTITNRQGEEVVEEGCLSIPGVLVNVRRPQTITVQYLNEQNQKVTLEYTDLLARVILHETDHLHGKLIIDYASLSEKLKLKDKLKELEQQNKKK